MGSKPASRVALISIRPEYAEAIFAGEKTVEFRRSRIAADIDTALVYVTQPVGRIVGWFEIAEVVEASPTGLWQRLGKSGGITRAVFRKYFAQAETAFGIVVKSTQRLAEPTSLDAIRSDLRAPQSFQYLPTQAATRVLAPATTT